MHIGIQIKLARISRKITQEQLGRLIGRKRPLISYIEQTGNINHATLDSICRVLNVSKADLLNQAAMVTKSKPGQDELRQLKAENKYLLEQKLYLHEINNMLKKQVNKLEAELKHYRKP